MLDISTPLAILERIDRAEVGLFEWFRENGVQVNMLVERDGTIRTWLDHVEQETLQAESYEHGRAVVTALSNQDTVR